MHYKSLILTATEKAAAHIILNGQRNCGGINVPLISICDENMKQLIETIVLPQLDLARPFPSEDVVANVFAITSSGMIQGAF